jgi:hypothetical protein
MIAGAYMERVHKEVYEPDGKWAYGSEPARPVGIQTLTVNGKTDIWPSWYNSKTSGSKKETLVFNKVSKKLAASCTAEALKESVEVTVMEDPLTKSKIYSGLPEGYDRENEDTCSDHEPTVAISGYDGSTLKFTAVKGTSEISSYTVVINGSTAASGSAKEGENSITVDVKSGDKVVVKVTDANGLTGASAEWQRTSN